jgi:hypothetical protein
MERRRKTMSEEIYATRKGGLRFTFFSSTHLFCELDALIVPEASRSHSQLTAYTYTVLLHKRTRSTHLLRSATIGIHSPFPSLFSLSAVSFKALGVRDEM